MVEEFLTRVDMAICYLDYAKQRESVDALIEQLKKEVEMNETLASTLSKNK